MRISYWISDLLSSDLRTVILQPLAQPLTLVHRRDEFRAAPDTVNKMRALVQAGQMSLEIAQVAGVDGHDGRLEAVIVKDKDGERRIECDALLAFYGLTMKLGPVEIGRAHV